MPDTDAFLKALSDNADLREKIGNCSSAEEAVKCAKEAGHDFTKKELVDLYKSQMTEMSDEQLSSVAGGKGVTSKDYDWSSCSHTQKKKGRAE